MSQQPTEYPAEWFPGVARKNAEAARREVMSGLEELPTGVLAQVLEQGRRQVRESNDGLAQGGGR
jgi:hypothetical protein